MAIDLRKYNVGEWFVTREGGTCQYVGVRKASIQYPYGMQVYNKNGEKVGGMAGYSIDGKICVAVDSKYDIMEVLEDGEVFDSGMMEEVNKVSLENIKLGYALDAAIEKILGNVAWCRYCASVNSCSGTPESKAMCVKRFCMKAAEEKLEALAK